jgi:hypothetical protein
MWKLCTQLLVNASSAIHNTRHRHEGCLQTCVAPILRTGDGDQLPLAATLVHGKDTTTLMQSTPYYTLRKSCCRRNVAKWWLIGCHVRYPARQSHLAHFILTASMRMRHKAACVSHHITMHRFRHTLVSLVRMWSPIPAQKLNTKSVFLI